MSAVPSLPCLVGVTACRKEIGDRFAHFVQEKYVAAASSASGVMPVLVPPLGNALDLDGLLDRLDGLLLTGSPSNVLPRHYDGPASAPGTLHDTHRDQTTLPLIRKAVSAGVPVLGLCRGFQELNVAFGGTLHQRVHELPGKLDHREDSTQPYEAQYGKAHRVELVRGGTLAELLGTTSIEVNSLHAQGVDRLAPGLEVEATAPDGLVEAFRVEGASTFALAVQWHPEWRVREDGPSLALFEAFGDACRARAAAR